MTPLKRRREEDASQEQLVESPQFFSPQGPSVIGPTPQRDGIVLGLFDMLPIATPSKGRTVLGDVEVNVLQTPSKQLPEGTSDTSRETGVRGGRTPLSSGKRFMLDQFVTPKKRRLDEEGTPSSSMRGLATPAFLRRNNALGAIDEADETTTRPAPWKRRSFARSLSAMIQGMKKDEDDRLDEEADIMREMELEAELEEQGISLPKKPSLPKKSTIPEILVEDSQAPMPLGPDRGLESEEDEEDAPELGPDGKPRKVWKKKGLKRQTRRVISKFTTHTTELPRSNRSPVRPNLAKPKPEPDFKHADESNAEADGIPETQVEADGTVPDEGSEDDESDFASDASHTPRKRTTKDKTQDVKDGAKEGLKAAGRKVKATAHANFRRLKIKSSKGAAAGKSRFGRRR